MASVMFLMKRISKWLGLPWFVKGSPWSNIDIFSTLNSRKWTLISTCSTVFSENMRKWARWKDCGEGYVCDHLHYSDVTMGTITSLINVYSDEDQRKHQSSASLAFVRGIPRRPVNSPHKGPVTQKMFPFDDVIMIHVLITKDISINKIAPGSADHSSSRALSLHNQATKLAYQTCINMVCILVLKGEYVCVCVCVCACACVRVRM